MITPAVLKKGIIDAIQIAIPGAKVFAEKIPQLGTVEPFFHLSFAMASDASGMYHETRGITATLRFFPAHSDSMTITDLAWLAFHTLNKKVFGDTITFTAAASDGRSVTADDTANTFTRTAHGLVDGVVGQFSGTSLPTGLTAATNYFVVNKTADTFQVALTHAGAAIDFTGIGESLVFATPTTRKLSLWRRRGEVVDDVLVFRFDLEFDELLDTASMATGYDLMEWFKMAATDPAAGAFDIASDTEPTGGD
jgi:hypothetical protein